MVIKLRLKGQMTGGIKTKVTQPSVRSGTPPRSLDTNPALLYQYHHSTYTALLLVWKSQANRKIILVWCTKVAKMIEKGHFINTCLGYFANFQGRANTIEGKTSIWKQSRWTSALECHLFSRVLPPLCACVVPRVWLCLLLLWPDGLPTPRCNTAWEANRESARKRFETKRTPALPMGWPWLLFDLFLPMWKLASENLPGRNAMKINQR